MGDSTTMGSFESRFIGWSLSGHGGFVPCPFPFLTSRPANAGCTSPADDRTRTGDGRLATGGGGVPVTGRGW